MTETFGFLVDKNANKEKIDAFDELQVIITKALRRLKPGDRVKIPVSNTISYVIVGNKREIDYSLLEQINRMCSDKIVDKNTFCRLRYITFKKTVKEAMVDLYKCP